MRLAMLTILVPALAVAVMPPVPAQVCETGGEFAQAVMDVRTSKREARAHHDRAVVLANHGCIKAAIEEDQLAIDGNPNQPGYQILMARLLVDHGQLQSALSIYECVCRRWPEQLEDLAELIVGLKMSIAFLKLDQALAHVQSCEPGTPPLSEGQLRRAVDAPSTLQAPLNPDQVKSPSAVKTAAHEIIKRLLSDGRPIDDPVY